MLQNINSGQWIPPGTDAVGVGPLARDRKSPNVPCPRRRYRRDRPIGCLLQHAVAGALLLAGCVPPLEKQVVVDCAVDRQLGAPILAAFERRFPETEVVLAAAKTDRQLQASAKGQLAEPTTPPADLSWSDEILSTIRLQRAGKLVPRRWKLPPDFPPSYVAADRTWVGLGGHGRVLIVHREKLPLDADRPVSVLELADPRWQGRCGLASPQDATSAVHLAVLASQGLDQRLAPADFEPWLERVRQTAVFLADDQQVARAVADGRLSWGLTDTDTAQVELDKGGPVAIVYPDQAAEQGGFLIVPTTIAVLQDGPHPLAAGELADYLASPETERRLTLGQATPFNLWRGVSRPETPSNDIPRWMQVDFEAAAAVWDSLAPRLQTVIAP
jgi:iron(III) transport system substrate-binding protein